MAKIQRVCFTLNNYSDNEFEHIKKAIENMHAVYGIIGREKGSNGTPHLQGYINSGRSSRLTFPGWKKAIGARAHIEKAKGDDEQNQKYCSKDGDFWEHGKVQYAGKRNDLESCCEIIKKGGTINDVCEQHPTTFVKYSKGLRDLSAVIARRDGRNFKTVVYVIVGPPGTGKSRLCFDASNAIGSTYYKSRGEWWDGYEGQTCVVMDDFYGWIKYDELLKIMDRYPYQVPIKGGYVPFKSKYLFITSNEPIENWYHFQGYNTTAIVRRVEHLWTDRTESELSKETELLVAMFTPTQEPPTEEEIDKNTPYSLSDNHFIEHFNDDWDWLLQSVNE